MKILVDENIPYAIELFSRLGEVKTVLGRSIPINELNNTDILIVRSVTKINKALLADKKIHFVGTATSGIDHIDHKWLIKSGIGFSFAPGCNNISVVEYVLSSLLMLSERDNFLLKDRTVGIVGVGKIGRLLKKILEVLKVPTLLCDPPRADKGDEENFCSINELITKCDVLTLHTPLLINGPYKSIHMINEKLIRRLKPGTILINTCRGSVVDNTALLKCLKTGQELSVVLDVWESEPDLNIELLKKVDVATAHIAGYTLEGKVRGTAQIFEACSRFLGKPQQVALNKLLPTPEFSSINMHGLLDQTKLKKLVHLIYDVQQDDNLLRRAVGIPGGFDNLRKHYFERREWSSLTVMCDDINTTEILNNLGFKAMYQKH